jgi:hypothetical protein
MSKLTPVERTRFLDKGIITVLTLGAAIGLLYYISQGRPGFLYLISNGLPPVLAFSALAVAIAGLIRNGVVVRNRVSAVWLGYSLGVMFWLLGESTWATYALLYSIPVPFPSLADGFWLAGYIPLLCAIAVQTWPFRQFFSSEKMLPVVSSIVILSVPLFGALVPSAYMSETGQSFLPIVVSLAYPFLDVMLLVFALPILFLFGRGTFWRPFLFVTVGLILTFIGDILFGWATSNGVYYDGSYLELFFHWGYLMLAYGFYLRFRSGHGTLMLE